MSGYAESWPECGPRGSAFVKVDWSGSSYHPPLLVKSLMVAAAFWLFHPLGVALLVIVLWRAARRHGGYAFRGAKVGRPWRRAGAAFPNAAFEERRRETLKALEEDAEAFEAFERKQARRAIARLSSASWPSAAPQTAVLARIDETTPRRASVFGRRRGRAPLPQRGRTASIVRPHCPREPRPCPFVPRRPAMTSPLTSAGRAPRFAASSGVAPRSVAGGARGCSTPARCACWCLD